MGGIPWWAALIGTPIVAGKMASGVAETVDSLNKVNESLDNRADKKQYAADLAAFGKDKSYVPQSSVYRNPETALKAIQSFQKEAAPSLMDQFKRDYEAKTGTTDPRFFGSADGQAELAKDGLKYPTTNPVFNASLADFQKEGAQRQTIKAALEGDSLALADLAADKELAPSFHQALQGTDLIAKRQNEAKVTAEKEQNAKNLAEYQGLVSGIIGQAKGAPQIAQFAKTNGYDPNAGADILAAASDYGIPSEVANKDADNYRQLMEKTPVGAPYMKNLKAGNATSQQMVQDYVLGGAKQVGSSITNHPPQPRAAGGTGSNGTVGTPPQVQAWSDKIASGQVVLSDIPARGSIRTQVISDLAQRYPDVDLAKVKANMKWTTSNGTAQTLALVDATKEIVKDMETAYGKLGRTGSPVVNAVQDKLQELTGNADRSEFITLKNYGIQEVEKMLSGSGQMSDHRVKLAFEGLKNSSTPEQFKRAVAGIDRVMAERERATRKGPFSDTTTKKGAAGATIAPAGTRVPRKGGGFYTSDGKGGWS